MKVFAGQFYGGPDDGNVVEATRDEIKVRTTTELWLDGQDIEKDTMIIETWGVYSWDDTEKLFIWKQLSTRLYTKKVEAA